MQDEIDLKAAVEAHPWRTRAGIPLHVAEPYTEDCPTPPEGIEYSMHPSGGWFCPSCGRIGFGTTVRHKPAVEPAEAKAAALRLYLVKRGGEGVSAPDALQQIDHLTAAVVLAAGKVPTSRLIELLNKIESLE